jgi:pimeloyl-ACP methyl ester carboxylesterase
MAKVLGRPERYVSIKAIRQKIDPSNTLFPDGRSLGADADISAPEEGRPVYLGTEPDATFAMLHLPAQPYRGATGVVFCPLYGWDDICTHRARRGWARALAQAGYPAVRLDLPGTGDSPGSPKSAGRLEGWTASVAAAAALLRGGLDCERVAAIGIGFGGMLAWLSAAEGAPVDDLLLWAVPTHGRRLIRAIHLSAKLSIDSRIEESFIDSQPVRDDDARCMLDESGQLTAPGTIAALEQIDLSKTPLPSADQRRVLVLERSGDSADAELTARLRDAGACVTVGNGDGYGRLMRYVQQSVVPSEVISTTISWLGSRSPSTSTAPISAPWTGASVTFEQDGTPLRETAVTISLPSGSVRGIITESPTTDAPSTTAVFISGSSDRRIGPNRMWVDAARRWAGQGVVALRFDAPGVGDSDGEERSWDQTRAHYDSSHVDRLIELLDALETSGFPPRFILIGFCSGAYRSLHTAARDRRVVGVLALAVPFFRWTHWAVSVRDSWLAAWEPKQDDSTPKIAIMRVLQHAIRLLHRVQHGLVRAGQHFTNHGESMLGRLDAQGTEVLLTLKPASYAHEQLDVPRRRRRIEALSRLRTLSLPNNDQRFRPLTSQRFVNEAIDAAIARVLAAGAARRPTSATAGAAGVARLPGQPLRDAGRPTFRSRPHSS